MISLTIGEIEQGKNGLLCVQCDDNGEILEQRPLGIMFQHFILELQATENDDIVPATVLLVRLFCHAGTALKSGRKTLLRF